MSAVGVVGKVTAVDIELICVDFVDNVGCADREVLFTLYVVGSLVDFVEVVDWLSVAGLIVVDEVLLQEVLVV